MTELSFAKSFLTTLSQRPQRLAPDYVEDPRKLPARTPYTLPRTLPDYIKPKEDDEEVEKSDASVNLTLKPLRPNATVPPLALPETPLSTTIITLKTKYSTATDTSPAKIKLLMKGKPLADDKTLNDLGLGKGEDVTLTVMVMGGGAVPATAISSPAEVHKVKALQDEEFWVELKTFLGNKLSDESIQEDPEEVLQAFRKAWEGRK